MASYSYVEATVERNRQRWLFMQPVLIQMGVLTPLQAKRIDAAFTRTYTPFRLIQQTRSNNAINRAMYSSEMSWDIQKKHILARQGWWGIKVVNFKIKKVMLYDFVYDFAHYKSLMSATDEKGWIYFNVCAHSRSEAVHIVRGMMKNYMLDTL